MLRIRTSKKAVWILWTQHNFNHFSNCRWICRLLEQLFKMAENKLSQLFNTRNTRL